MVAEPLYAAASHLTSTLNDESSALWVQQPSLVQHRVIRRATWKTILSPYGCGAFACSTESLGEQISSGPGQERCYKILLEVPRLWYLGS
jgi:hypothetical protein